MKEKEEILQSEQGEAADTATAQPCKAKIIIPVCLVTLFAVLMAVAYYLLPSYCVVEEVTIEAGSAIPTSAAFLKWENTNAVISSGIDENTDTHHVQDIALLVELYHQQIPTVLHIQDTISPEMTTRDLSIMYGDSVEADDFVETLSDMTDCVVSFVEEPQIEGGGMYAISLVAIDEGGNRCQVDAMLEVIQDITPPVIDGVKEITITEGDTVSYKKDITVTDDMDEKVTLVVDNSQVDTDVPGDYTVIYSATDSAGNTTEISTTLHVEAVVVAPVVTTVSAEITEDVVNAAADKILASITNESMSQYEVIEAIYNWCHSKIAYLDGSPKDDWVVGAYYGLVKRQGDCYTYAMTAKCLLTRAGITNMDIERVPVGDGMHFWNLVDIGEGWHHFDTCRRADGSTFFYLTDAELMAYSEAHTATNYPDGTHYYDRSLYPEIP